MGALAIYFSEWFLVPFFLLIFVVPHILKGIVCPKCRTPVTYQGSVSGFRIHGGFIRKKCQQCRWDLNRWP